LKVPDEKFSRVEGFRGRMLEGMLGISFGKDSTGTGIDTSFTTCKDAIVHTLT